MIKDSDYRAEKSPGIVGKLGVKVLGMLSVLAICSLFASASPAGAVSLAGSSLKAVVRPPGVPAQTLVKPNVRLLTPSLAWRVSLTASTNLLWPTRYSTLTATANQNVGPTPYWLRIYDQTSGAYVATCGSGTTCTASVTEPTATTHNYLGLISLYSTVYPPAGQQAVSSTVSVTWEGVTVSLAASPTTLPTGAVSTLTATTSTNVGPSPFYTEIFDATTGARLAVCGTGTSCSATTSQWVATTHKFVAYVSNYSTTFPPAGLQATSNASFVTWSSEGYRVSLSGPTYVFGSETVTATSNINVGPTPYWIEIFNETGTRLAVCGSGTTCSATLTPSYAGTHLVAFVSSNDSALPPSNTKASSKVLTSYRSFIFLPRHV